MKKLVLIALLTTFFLSNIAQVNYVERIEFELKDGYSDEEFYEFGEYGFIMKSLRDKEVKGQNEWKYELFNTSLQSEDGVEVLLDSKLYPDETFNTDKATHTFYSARKGKFAIVSVDVESMETSKVEGQLPKKAWIKDMVIMGDYAIFNASIKRVPFIFSINLNTGEKEFLPIRIKGFSKKKISIINFQVLEESNEVFVFVRAAISRKFSDLYIIRLDEDGQQDDIYNLSKDIDENIVSISAFAIDEGKYIFTGTYSSKFMGISEGLFFCQGEDSEIDFINFYSFTELEDFLSYLPKRKQKKIDKKKSRKAKRGKELVINYRIADHDVITVEDGFIFLGEAYYPTYRQEAYTTTSVVNGRSVTTTSYRSVFDGYQYTHAVVAKFDQEGEMVWDRCFTMNPFYKPFFVKRFISIAEKDEDSFKMVFASYNRIYSMTYDYDGNLDTERKSDEIETSKKGDKTKYSFTNLDYWYDNFFLAHGYQKIKNKKDKSVKRKRKVIFVSKIEY